MNKKVFSRRDFLRMISGLSGATVLGKLLNFFPEADPVFAKSDPSTNDSLPPLPSDLVVEPIEGKKASVIISEVMKSADGLALRSRLPSPFQPVLKEARVSSAVWANRTQNALLVSIPFLNHQGEDAVLQQVTLNGATETMMVVIPEDLDITKARIYTIGGKEIRVIDAATTTAFDAVAAAVPPTCNRTAIINCVKGSGCSGLALTMCVTSLLTCPWTVIGCIAATVCTIYCGVSFSKCWCRLCGC